MVSCGGITDCSVWTGNDGVTSIKTGSFGFCSAEVEGVGSRRWPIWIRFGGRASSKALSTWRLPKVALSSFLLSSVSSDSSASNVTVLTISVDNLSDKLHTFFEEELVSDRSFAFEIIFCGRWTGFKSSGPSQNKTSLMIVSGNSASSTSE